jgi:hypothetical protein
MKIFSRFMAYQKTINVKQLTILPEISGIKIEK